MIDERVIVIGAGPAGLASAAELGRLGVTATVLEQASVVGRVLARPLRPAAPQLQPLVLAPARRALSAFGRHVSLPRRDGRYLEAYARDNKLDVRLDTRVDRIDRDGSGWTVRTSAGNLRAAQVIVAGGYARVAQMPEWPGRDEFGGSLLHAADYRNADRFSDDDVLVVGSGSSGMEIAYDLVTGGARRVRLAVRTPPNILVRAPLGPLFARALLKLGPQRADRVMPLIRRLEVGDLTEFGLPQPEEGVFARLKRLNVAPAIVDKVVIDAIKDRRIEIVAGVESLDATGVRLADGTRVEPDAVVAATGYRPALEPVVGHLGVLDDGGMPQPPDGGEAAPGLRFVGYLPRPAHLGLMGREATRAAEAIAARGAARAVRPSGLPRLRRGRRPGVAAQ